jgi:hypothetical protein
VNARGNTTYANNTVSQHKSAGSNRNSRQPEGFVGNYTLVLRNIFLLLVMYVLYICHPDSLDQAYDAMSREMHATIDTVVAIPIKYFVTLLFV